MNLDQHLMRRAIDLAKRAPQAPFGAVIADAAGKVLAEGWNRGEDNRVLHGEIAALLALPGGVETAPQTWVLLTTAEPCPMCMAAILWTGIGRVVYGTSIPTLQRLGWQQIEVRAEEIVRRTPFARCILAGGMLEAECDRLFAPP